CARNGRHYYGSDYDGFASW
nr:immunoglobulin heavy chain junction region [Macaca mulatta]